MTPMSASISASMPVTGNTTHTHPENRAFYPALDGLRAIAFLMVFCQHYARMPWGWTGVNAFFVLSGFLITGILYDTRDAPHRARNFYVRRTLRIFPLYYGIFLLLLILHPLMHWQWTFAWIAWPLYLANFLRFLSPSSGQLNTPLELAADAHLGSARLPLSQLYLGHFWSLCVEEQFYLFWPWVVFWLRSRRLLVWICGSAVVFVPLIRIVAQHTAPRWMLEGELLYRATPFQLDSLLLGGLVALLWRGTHRQRLLQLGRIVAMLCGIATVLYLALTLHGPFAGYTYPSWKFTWGLTFVNVFSAALILCCLQTQGWLTRLLSLRPLRWLGRISYGAYVLHDILHGLYVHVVVHTLQRHPDLAGLRNPASMAVALVGTLVLAWLSFRFFESPFLNLKEKLTRTA